MKRALQKLFEVLRHKWGYSAGAAPAKDERAQMCELAKLVAFSPAFQGQCGAVSLSLADLVNVCQENRLFIHLIEGEWKGGRLVILPRSYAAFGRAFARYSGWQFAFSNGRLVEFSQRGALRRKVYHFVYKGKMEPTAPTPEAEAQQVGVRREGWPDNLNPFWFN